MDSQIERQDGRDYDQNNPSGMEGREDNQQGKTSVLLKKVKAKARKIKDALKKKDGNGDQDNNQNDEGHEEEEEYDDDEMVEDSEVHDSVPMNESPAAMNTAAGQNPRGNLEKPTVAAGTFGTPASESAANFVPGEEAGHTGQRPKISMETPKGMEEEPHAPKDRLDEANYQSKVTDPTGAGGETD